jgi:hypothetical protein
MADERERAPQPKPAAASESKIQTGGRKMNAAQPLNAADDHGGAERYPQAADEQRSFKPGANPAPRQGAGDTSAAPDEGLQGPRGDPAEGKR